MLLTQFLHLFGVYFIEERSLVFSPFKKKLPLNKVKECWTNNLYTPHWGKNQFRIHRFKISRWNVSLWNWQQNGKLLFVYFSVSHTFSLSFIFIYLHSMLQWSSVNKSSLTKLWKIITCDTVFSLRCHVTTFPISRQSQIIFSHTGRSSPSLLRNP